MDVIDYPILTEFTIQTDAPSNIALTDPVLCFNNSNEWIVVDFDELLKTPIIWTKMYTENKIKDVSIVVCPRTLRSCVFDGKLKSKYYDGEKLILENQEKSLIPIDFNISVDLDNNLEINKRYQISIKTLRNSLVDYYDIKYLIPNTSFYFIYKNIKVN